MTPTESAKVIEYVRANRVLAAANVVYTKKIKQLEKNVKEAAVNTKPLLTGFDLSNGRIVYDPPEVMKAHHEELVDIIVSRDLMADIEKELKGTGKPQGGETIPTGGSQTQIAVAHHPFWEGHVQVIFFITPTLSIFR